MSVKSIVTKKDAVVLIKGMKRTLRFSEDTAVNYSTIDHNGRKIVLKFQPNGLKGDPKRRTVEIRAEDNETGKSSSRRFLRPRGFYRFFDLPYNA